MRRDPWIEVERQPSSGFTRLGGVALYGAHSRR
jgi:hypothetical protein